MYRVCCVFVLTFLFVGLSLFNPVYASYVSCGNVGVEREDGVYSIMVYRFNHGCVEKIVKKVSYEDVSGIKKEFRSIDEGGGDFFSRMMLKFKTLVNYGVLSENILRFFDGEAVNFSSVDVMSCGDKPLIYGFFGLLFGVCELSPDVYFNFGMWTFSVFPFLVYGRGSGTVRYYELSGTSVPSGYYALDFSNWVFVMSATLIGVFLFVPFVSPAGFFAGFSVLTMVVGE